MTPFLTPNFSAFFRMHLFSWSLWVGLVHQVYKSSLNKFFLHDTLQERVLSIDVDESWRAPVMIRWWVLESSCWWRVLPDDESWRVPADESWRVPADDDESWRVPVMIRWWFLESSLKLPFIDSAFAKTATDAKVRLLRSFYATKVALRSTGSNARYR